MKKFTKIKPANNPKMWREALDALLVFSRILSGVEILLEYFRVYGEFFQELISTALIERKTHVDQDIAGIFHHLSIAPDEQNHSGRIPYNETAAQEGECKQPVGPEGYKKHYWPTDNRRQNKNKL